LLPLLLGCAAAYLVALLTSRVSLLTGKLAKREANVRTEYAVDHLAHVIVRQAASPNVVTIAASRKLGEVRGWLRSTENGKGPGSHQGFPVVDDESLLVGVITRRELLDASISDNALVGELLKRSAAVVYEDNTLRDAADHMVLEEVGRLPVVSRENPRKVVGMISRSDLLSAHGPRLDAELQMKRAHKWRR
jgi:CBS domain-containing protein